MSLFRKRKALHGQKLYITDDDDLVAKGAVVSGGVKATGNKGGTIVLPGSADTVAFFTDFLGDLLPDELAVVEQDTGADLSNAIGAGTNGFLQLTTAADVHNKGHADAHAVTMGLFKQWKANQGKLHVATRVKQSDISSVHAFAGLSDSGGAETPIYDTGGAQQSAATDAVGWMFAPAGGTTVWQGVATGSTSTVTGDAPVANVYDVLEVDVDASGNATYKQNGIVKGYISGAVTATTALTPWVGHHAVDTGNFTQEIDYLNVSAGRDTGT